MSEEMNVTPKECAEAIEILANAGGNVAEKVVEIEGELQDQKNEQRIADLEYKKALADYIDERLAKAPENIHNAEATVIAALEASTNVWEKLRGTIKIKDHGSKVKEGVFAECPIDDVGEVRIIIDETHKNDIMLTSATVKECVYLKEKERQRGLKKKMYYYYKITFVDDQECYIRISEKYRNILVKEVKVTYK